MLEYVLRTAGGVRQHHNHLQDNWFRSGVAYNEQFKCLLDNPCNYYL